MRTIIIFLFIYFQFTNLFAQEALVKKALNHGKNSDQYYEVDLSKKLISPEKLQSWYNEHKNEYYLIDYKTETGWFAGSTRTLVSGFSFIKVDEINLYNSYQAEKINKAAREAQFRAQNDAQNFLFLAVAIGATAYVAQKIYTSAVKAGAGISSSENSSSISNNPGSYSSTMSSLSAENKLEENKKAETNSDYKSATTRQSSPDYRNGNFTPPSYKENGWVDMNKSGLDGQCVYYFSDGKSRTLWYSKDCSKYYVKEVGVKVYYPSKDMAIKALYAKEKDGCDMKGSVNCN